MVTNKKFIALLTALSLLMPVLGITVAADDEDEPTRPKLTVVGKRITDDNSYFEISLEVNDDYEDYTSVGVVLKYDKSVIVPAESWDEDSPRADMAENTSWATRRALPTLGKDTWTAHTAFAYEEPSTNDGYLYLGAEYPGAGPTPTPDPDATPDPEAEDVEPTATPAIGQTPIVVARFMYATKDEVQAQEAVIENGVVISPAVPHQTAVPAEELKEKIIENIPSPAPDGSWVDWKDTTILTIASDAIAADSPAMYPFAIYDSDFNQSVYMFNPPSPEPTVDPAAAETPTPKPLSAYAPVVGADLTAEELASETDIDIVTTEGDSANTGGLKLSDIFVILFYDWDDTLLGTLTSGIGVDATESVNNYVEETFIHPDLRSDATDYADIIADENKNLNERQYNYRGEYNSEKPGVGVTYPDGSPNAGSIYPLTNKLDYCFAGKDFIQAGVTLNAKGKPYKKSYPFAGGWVRVQAGATSDVWTSLEAGDDFRRMPEQNDDGTFVDPTETEPDMVSFDFSNVTANTLRNESGEKGNLYVKAVYTPGNLLDYGGTSYYTPFGDVQEDMLMYDESNAILSLKFKYHRVNDRDCGATRLKAPGINMEFKQFGANSTTNMPIFPVNSEILEVELTPSYSVETVDYMLHETDQADIIGGAQKSLLSSFGTFYIGGGSGLWWKIMSKDFLENAYSYAMYDDPSYYDWLDYDHCYALSSYMKLSSDAEGSEIFDFMNWDYADNILKPLMQAVDTDGDDYRELTWYQIQYAFINFGAYVNAETAQSEIENNYPTLNDKLFGRY